MFKKKTTKKTNAENSSQLVTCTGMTLQLKISVIENTFCCNGGCDGKVGWFTVGNTRFSRLTSAFHIYLFWIKMSVITKSLSITLSSKWFMCSLFNCRFGKCPLLVGNWHIMTWILEEIIDIQKQWISITFPVRSLVWLCIKLSLGSLIYLIQGKVEQELLYKKGHICMFAHIR